MTNYSFNEKKIIFCLFVKENNIPLQSLYKKRNMSVTNLINLAILHIIRVVVITSGGEKGCMY